MSTESPDRSRAVPVTIFGQSYTLRTDDDPAEVASLAALVDARMREVADKTRTADTVKIAILAALNIADDLRRRERQAEADRRDRDARARAMADRLEAALAG